MTNEEEEEAPPPATAETTTTTTTSGETTTTHPLQNGKRSANCSFFCFRGPSFFSSLKKAIVGGVRRSAVSLVWLGLLYFLLLHYPVRSCNSSKICVAFFFPIFSSLSLSRWVNRRRSLKKKRFGPNLLFRSIDRSIIGRRLFLYFLLDFYKRVDAAQTNKQSKNGYYGNTRALKGARIPITGRTT